MIEDILKSKPLFKLTQDELREARTFALRILQANYDNDVCDAANTILAAIKSKEITNRDELLKYTHETCGSDQRVIYTSQAIEAFGMYYVHVGGHSAALLCELIQLTRPATLEESAGLKSELERSGYDLRVMRHATAKHYHEQQKNGGPF